MDVDKVIGERIARGRRRKGMRQIDLAARLDVSESWISKLERGERRLDSIQVAERIASVLSMSAPYVLALDLRYPDASAPASLLPSRQNGGRSVGEKVPRRDWQEMLRRTFMFGSAVGLRQTLSAALHTPAPESAYQIIRAPEHGQLIDDTTVADLQSVAASYRRAYRAVPAPALLPLAHGHLELLLSLHPGAHPEPRRRALMVTMGEMATLAGVLLMLDLGQYDQATPYFQMAGKVARAVDDPELSAVVLGCQAFYSAYSGHPDDGLDYALAAQGAAERGACARTRGWVAAVASEMHATAGDEFGCRQALDGARAALDRTGDDDRRWSGVGWFDASKLSGYEGGDMVRLGRFAEALPVLDAALAGLSPSMRRHRSTALVDRAEALVASGEVEQGCADASRALDIVTEVQHAETLRRITALSQGVRPSRTQATRALAEQLSMVKGGA